MIRDMALKQDDTLAGVMEMVDLGQIANQFASAGSFDDYRSRKADNTLRRQDGDLALFGQFLREKGAEPGQLATDPDAWKGISWGLVAAFQRWQLAHGYAVAAVNVRVSTVKTYSKLALKSGTLSAEGYALIRAVEGYSRMEAGRIDRRRQDQDILTRQGSKKGSPVELSRSDEMALKSQPDTPQGRRDALLMCLLLDHGLRVGEVARLRAEDVDLTSGTFQIYRPKVDKTQRHKMTVDTLRAARRYLDVAPFSGRLLMGSVKRLHADQAELSGDMSERAINKRVRVLGAALGISGLSPHDCRHYAATKYAPYKTLRDLQDIFGWTSPAMAARYIQSAEVVDPGSSLQ